MSKTVIALFDSASRAQQAVEALKASGFVNERIQVQTGDEFIKQGHAPPVGKPHTGLYSGIKNFFDEIGLTSPDGPRPGEYHAVSARDAVILLETSDERADSAAEVLDNAGAVDVEERLEKGGKPNKSNVASGLEPATSGKTPPQDRAAYDDVDERSLVDESRVQKTESRRSRIYGPHNEPYGDDWAPKGPTPH
jgi:hypothetical protein